MHRSQELTIKIDTDHFASRKRAYLVQQRINLAALERSKALNRAGGSKGEFSRKAFLASLEEWARQHALAVHRFWCFYGI